MSKIIILLVFASVIWLFASAYRRTQQAMQWWFQSQSVKLAASAEVIQDDLLQESFSMRRTLESLSEPDNITQNSQEWLKTLDNFHYSLTELSDRLAPPHIEHSLPLAIKWLSQSWQKINPQLKIETNLPTDWRDEQLTHSLVVIRVLDELLRITLTAFTAESTQISLKKPTDMYELFLYISFPCLTTLISYCDLKELQYLRQTFRVLTSGQCFCHTEALTVKWCFRWQDREKRLTK